MGQEVLQTHLEDLVYSPKPCILCLNSDQEVHPKGPPASELRLPSCLLTDQLLTEGLPLLLRMRYQSRHPTGPYNTGPYKKPLGSTWVGSWGSWLPGSLHRRLHGEVEPAADARGQGAQGLGPGSC